ncbi:MAG TPA: GNAT family protein [Natronosporangium sp.]
MAPTGWPLYELRLRTPDLELRLPTEDELDELCRLARAGFHDPAEMPFLVPWTDRPSPQFEREFFKYHWGVRARWAPEHWELELAVFRDGEPIGFQSIFATDFPILREVKTGSWLGAAFQGRGYGKQMRTAVLQLAFEELGALAAESSAFTDNQASLAVSRALGYQPNGVDRAAPRGEPRELIRLRLTRERWQERRFCQVEISGIDACRDMFGV